MENRIAAYVYLFVAGVASATLGFVLLDGPSALTRLFTHPHSRDLEFIGLAGVAAVIAAAIVHAPFLRAARARNRTRVYAWTLGGVLASHAAYVALVFFLGILQDPLTKMEHQLGFALFAGLFSMFLGFLPNMAWGLCLAEAVLWQEKLRRAASPRTEATGSLAP